MYARTEHVGIVKSPNEQVPHSILDVVSQNVVIRYAFLPQSFIRNTNFNNPGSPTWQAWASLGGLVETTERDGADLPNPDPIRVAHTFPQHTKTHPYFDDLPTCLQF